MQGGEETFIPTLSRITDTLLLPHVRPVISTSSRTQSDQREREKRVHHLFYCVMRITSSTLRAVWTGAVRRFWPASRLVVTHVIGLDLTKANPTVYSKVDLINRLSQQQSITVRVGSSNNRTGRSYCGKFNSYFLFQQNGFYSTRLTRILKK